MKLRLSACLVVALLYSSFSYVWATRLKVIITPKPGLPFTSVKYRLLIKGGKVSKTLQEYTVPAQINGTQTFYLQSYKGRDVTFDIKYFIVAKSQKTAPKNCVSVKGSHPQLRIAFKKEHWACKATPG
jgi:hypothetical protein